MSASPYYEEHTQVYRVRPRFEIESNASVDDVVQKIKTSLDQGDGSVKARIRNGFATLFLPEEEQHFWSPRLNLSLYEEGEDKTQICGVYGPKTNVWAFFLYGYLFVGFLALISGVFAISQWAIGSDPKALWFFVPAFLGVLALYISAQMGQKIGAQQTFQLHQVYESAVGEHTEIR